MKHYIYIILILFAAFGCDKPAYEKPVKLIKEKQMIQMMVDIHLAELFSLPVGIPIRC
jgi:hypothetical protein